MTFTVTRDTLQHVQGTKEYHLLMIQNKLTNFSLVVLRWGKTNQWGQMTVENGESSAMAKVFEKKRREKEGRDYSVIRDSRAECAGWEEIRNKIGVQYWNALGSANIEAVMPGALTAGVRDPVAHEFEEGKNGKWKVKPPEPKPMAPVKEETFEERQARDPLYGVFG